MYRTIIAVIGVLALGLAFEVQAAEQPVATVGKHAITRAELEKHVKSKLISIDNQRYQALKQGLDEMIAESLIDQEAKAEGISPQALQKKEITDKITEPTDAEVKKVYDQHKEQLHNASLDSIKPRIINYLKQQKAAAVAQAYLAKLKKKYKTKVNLHPPVVHVSTAGRPMRGNPNAPVTIIAFSDYQCPFCKRAEPTVEKVLKDYGDKVRFVYRDFPLSFHKFAREAAEAANCANSLGKFWPYHDKLIAAQDLSVENLKKLAGEVGMNQKKFDTCLKEKKFSKDIDKDIAAGTAAGVDGTPAFFINGRMLSGAQPYAKFKEVIDEELARN